MTDTTRRWDRLWLAGAELANNRGYPLSEVRKAVAEAARDFETATPAEPEAHAVGIFLDGLLGALAGLHVVTVLPEAAE